MDEYRIYHPDQLVARVWQITDSWQPSRLEKLEADAEADEFLALRPRLEGGGSLYAEYGPEHFALVGEAFDTPLGRRSPAPTPTTKTTSSRSSNHPRR